MLTTKLQAMLIDTAEVTFKGGHGGPGIVSFGDKIGSGPNGGNGGRGGDLYVKATSDITLLNQFSQKTLFVAGSGIKGDTNRMSGKDGKDLEILLPVGTSIIDKKTGFTIFELTEIGQRELLLKGGKGGKGNYEFRGPKRTTPEFAQPGLPGEERLLTLSLKLIADFGLIGLPNAGKSSLLNEITNAQAKIGNYAFTTLSPNIGVFEGKFIADIPGLIEGAAGGKGLGIGFLKHIEKVSTLLHCISSESSNPVKDYQTVRSEMGQFSGELLAKKEIILLTKSDLVDKTETKNIISELKAKTKVKKVLAISIHDWESIEKLKKLLTK